MPQPYAANITGIKPNVSPQTLSEIGEVIYDKKNCALSHPLFALPFFGEKARPKPG
jgi:hypothetical protein